MGLAESHLIPLPSLHGRKGSSSLGRAPHNDIINFKSVVGIKPGDSDMMIRYHVDEYTCTLPMEYFIPSSLLHPGFMGKVLTLNHFPLKAGCENYPFWTRLLKTLSMVLILSSETLLTYWNRMHPLMRLMLYILQSSGFLCLVSTISDNSRLQLAPSIKSCKLWCQARYICLSPRQVRCELLSLFITFPSIIWILSFFTI